MRTKRWTPDSVFSHPCELCPLTTMVADLMPASSPPVSSISSTSNFCRSAQRMYMRRSILAQSQLSVPPAPECTSRYVSFASASPESSASSWCRSPSAFKSLKAAIPSASLSWSPSASPSSTKVAASKRSRSIFASEPRRSSSTVRSRITFSARLGSVHRLGSSDFALSSPRRRLAASTSKMPPQQSHGLLDRFDQLFGFGAHDPTNEIKHTTQHTNVWIIVDNFGPFNRARLSRSQLLARFGTMSERIRPNHRRPHKNLAAQYPA